MHTKIFLHFDTLLKEGMYFRQITERGEMHFLQRKWNNADYVFG